MLDRTLTATRMGALDQWRRPLLLVMLGVIPIVFISWGARATPETPRPLTVPDGDYRVTDMKTLMTIVDVPIAVAFLAGLVGVFVVGSALDSDRRLVIAGFTPGEVIAPRLIVLGAAVLLISLVSLVVMAFTFTPEQWGPFAVANVVVGLEYAAVGGLAGALLGRLGAVYFMFFLPNIDIGIAQDPLFFSADPPGWAVALPGYGATRMIVDAGLSPDLDTLAALGSALLWLLALVVALVALLHRAIAPKR